jgi:nitrogen fixation/metabolism regulation signal transduction histidine kinase
MISIPSVILGILVSCVLGGAAIYYQSLRPARLIEKWAAGLSNGGHFPKKPVVNGLYWLLPVHREMQAVSDKIEGLKRQLEEAKSGGSHDEFLKHCVLASLLEGVMVADSGGTITLANVEFIHMFQLNQSPLQRPMSEVIRDKKMQAMILEAMTTSRVQSGRFTRPAATVEVGRPQTIEVSAVPLRLQKDKVGGVIVLFLPPPDRLRIVQDMKRHAQRLNNLVSEVAFTRVGGHDAALLSRQTLDLPGLLNEVLSGFAAKAENHAIKIQRHFGGGPATLNANVDQVQLALMHLLDNLTFDLDSVSEIAVEVQRDHGAVAIQTTFTGGSIPEVQLRRALALPLDLNVPGLPVIGGASLGLVRAVMERHSGSVEASITDAKQLCVTLRFPDDHPEKLTTEVPLLKPKSEPA